ncbi:hypothetical protein BC830DRAFT_1063472 [Chytriomyces sp. MP71]|nr:hypothetical protein BC830DRAFT_1063472 [Chytriomyces sp. MP71]
MPTPKKLLVRIGSSYQDLQIFNTNDDANPAFIDGPLFCGNVVMRIKNNNNGVTTDSRPSIPSSEYFGTRRRLFSLQLQGRFKEPINGDDFIQGTIWHKPVRLPFGTSVVLKIATLLDSTFSHDLYAAKPWTYSTALSSQNILNVAPAPEGLLPTGRIDSSQAKQVLGKWVWGGKKELEEDNALISRETLPFARDACEPRRKWFQKKANRQAVTLTPDKVYSVETYSPFVDFNTMDLHMGITVPMLKYTDGQPHTIVFKCASKNMLIAVVEFRLVDVDADGRPILEDFGIEE